MIKLRYSFRNGSDNLAVLYSHCWIGNYKIGEVVIYINACDLFSASNNLLHLYGANAYSKTRHMFRFLGIADGPSYEITVNAKHSTMFV